MEVLGTYADVLRPWGKNCEFAENYMQMCFANHSTATQHLQSGCMYESSVEVLQISYYGCATPITVMVWTQGGRANAGRSLLGLSDDLRYHSRSSMVLNMFKIFFLAQQQF